MSTSLNKGKINNYFENPKNPNIYTPYIMGKWLHNKINYSNIPGNEILDLCCGSGNLSWKFEETGCSVIGVDIIDHSKDFKGKFYKESYFEFADKLKSLYEHPKFILINSPWNNPKKLFGKAYLPEMFLRKILKVYGPDIKIVMFTSYTLLMNSRINTKSRKYNRQDWLRDCGADITHIVQLPLDFFPNVKMWNHILFFNFDDSEVNIKRFDFLSEDFKTDYYKEVTQ